MKISNEVRQIAVDAIYKTAMQLKKTEDNFDKINEYSRALLDLDAYWESSQLTSKLT